MKKKIKKFFKLIFFLILPLCSFASEEDFYNFLWLDPDKKVYVLQNKIYKKKYSLYSSVGYIWNPGSDFQTTRGIHGSLGFYFHEEWSLEGLYHEYSNKPNESYENVFSINEVIPFIRRPLSKYGLCLVYSPFYGKINTFNKIIYFDWSFAVGGGKIQTESNAKTVTIENKADEYDHESTQAFLLRTALRIHFTQNFHVNVEYHYDAYRATGPYVDGIAGKEAIKYNPEIMTGVGISF